MLGTSSTAAATLSTNTSTATPGSPQRPGRRRGLSYLRNYTHPHSQSGMTLTTPRVDTTDVPNSDVVSLSPSSTSNRRTSTRRDNAFLRPRPSATETPVRLSRSPTVSPGQARSSSSATSPSTRQVRSPLSGLTATSATAPNTAFSAPLTTAPDTTFSASSTTLSTTTTDKKDALPSIRFIPYHETRASRPSLPFPIVTRSVPTSSALVRVGRYSERDNHGAGQSCLVPPVGFKSKVVSRSHCEFWCSNNQWYIRDVRSSSGTFLNHIRLSSPGVESRPYPVNDGDLVQLGIDFKGGEEVIFRCVKIRVECNRGWQKALNEFNTSTHRRLRDLAKSAPGSPSSAKDDDARSVNTSECSICLNPVAPCQALFVAPCSHVWHFKCVRTLILPTWPSFQCPNCRGFADLDADVEPPDSSPDDDAGTSCDEDLRLALLLSGTDAAIPETDDISRRFDNLGLDVDDLNGQLNGTFEPRSAPVTTSVLSSTLSTTPTSTVNFALAGMMTFPEDSRTERAPSTRATSQHTENNDQDHDDDDVSTSAPIDNQNTPRNNQGPFL